MSTPPPEGMGEYESILATLVPGLPAEDSRLLDAMARFLTSRPISLRYLLQEALDRVGDSPHTTKREVGQRTYRTRFLQSDDAELPNTAVRLALEVGSNRLMHRIRIGAVPSGTLAVSAVVENAATEDDQFAEFRRRREVFYAHSGDPNQFALMQAALLVGIVQLAVDSKPEPV